MCQVSGGGFEAGTVGVAVDVEIKCAQGRIGKVATDLDECRPEVNIPQVEVVHTHPPIGLGESPLHRTRGRLALISGPDPLELLSHPDRSHPRLTSRCLAVQMRAHQLQLGAHIILTELHPRDVVGLGERRHRTTNRCPIWLNNAGEANG